SHPARRRRATTTATTAALGGFDSRIRCAYNVRHATCARCTSRLIGGRAMASGKSRRIYLRASAEQTGLIRRAAETQRKSTSQFVLDSACRSAESALYDLR